MMKLTGKVAVITGGGRGIGAATAKKMFAQGATVIVCARTEAEIEQIARGLDPELKRAAYIVADVADEQHVARMSDAIIDRWGRCDILVNNAGVCRLAPADRFSVADWDEVMRINVRGTFLPTRYLLPTMIKQKSGQIVNVSSMMGMKGAPTVGAYCASKHAVVGYSRAIREELYEHGIRVSVVCPREVDTKMRRDLFPDLDGSTWLSPDEIAEAIMYCVLRQHMAGIQELIVGLPQM